MSPWDGHPEMLIFDEFLWECHDHPHMHPGSTLEMNHPETHDCVTGKREICFTGAIFKDSGLIYRIDDYNPECHSWWGRWPD